MRIRTLLAASTFAALIPAFAQAQAKRSPVVPRYTKILELDAADIIAPALSPNGRWIVYGGAVRGVEGHTLWIVPAAGGTPRRLTTGDHIDRIPVWFPGSDRLLFSSTRFGGALVTMGVDPAAGTATETPRRLTLEAAGSHYAVSPDARWVVYNAGTNAAPGPLRVIPATGGSARTVDSVPPGQGGFLSPAFTRDSRHIEYVYSNGTSQVIRRIAVDGGRPVDVLRGVPGMFIRYANGIVADTKQNRDTVWLRNLAGDTLGSWARDGLLSSPAWQGVRFTSQPNTMLAAAMSASMEVRILSTDGGPSRSARPDATREYIASFLADGRIAVSTSRQGRDAVDVLPASAGDVQHIELPPEANFRHLSRDGKLAFWSNGTTYNAMDVATRTSRVVSRNYLATATDYASYAGTGDEEGFAERVNGRVEMRAWSPATNGSRLLRAFASPGQTFGEFTFHGDLVAYTAVAGDSVAVYVAANANAPAHHVFTARGRHSDAVAFSRDGRRLAFATQMVTATDSGHAIGFVDLNADGSANGPARVTPAHNVMGRLAWMPNGNEVVYLLVDRNGQTSMMRLASKAGAMPRSFSQSERGSFYDFVMSPDGKWVAYPTPTAAKATLWRVDLPGLDARVTRPR